MLKQRPLLSRSGRCSNVSSGYCNEVALRRTSLRLPCFKAVAHLIGPLLTSARRRHRMRADVLIYIIGMRFNIVFIAEINAEGLHVFNICVSEHRSNIPGEA